MNGPRTARETLLTVARNEGWTILHDLGLHVVLERGPRQASVQFDGEGHCIWASGAAVADLSPIDVALRLLINHE